MYYFLDKDFWNTPALVAIFLTTVLAIIFIRYIGLSFIYHRILGWFTTSKRNAYRLKKNQIQREIKWSFLSSLVFTCFSAGCFWAYQQDLTKIYDDVWAYPIWYLCISPVVMLLLYETYYYWLHRAMHIPGIYKIVHHAHHQSMHPTVFTSFCFHPLEAILQFLFFPLLILFIPVHYVVLLIVLMVMTCSAIINHSGVEIIHKKFLLNHFIGATHHDLHHTEFKTNFGLYFTWWDRLMKTESKTR